MALRFELGGMLTDLGWHDATVANRDGQLG
jgi:hypothetical protein